MMLSLSHSFFILLFVASAFYQKSFAEIDFEIVPIKVGELSLKVALADDPQKRRRGMMGKSRFEDFEGMLFVFPSSQPLIFWMRNTFLDLDIGFFDSKGKLFEIVHMAKAQTLLQREFPSYRSSKPGQFALEVPKGWFKQHEVPTGAQLTLLETSGLSRNSRPSEETSR